MLTGIRCLFLLIAQHLLLVLSAPVQVQNDQKFCDQPAREMYQFLSSNPHQFTVVGMDDSFKSLYDDQIEGDLPGPEGVMWNRGRTRMLKARHNARNDDADYYKVQFCKMEQLYVAHFDRFPFYRKEVTCRPNKNLLAILPDSHVLLCEPIVEQRPILKLKDGCNSLSSHSEETYVYSVEEVVVGCSAKVGVGPTYPNVKYT